MEIRARMPATQVLAFIGLLAGPVVLTLTTVALYALFDAEALRDGQFAMIYLVTVPFGVLLGGVAGASARLACKRERRAGGRCAAIGGLVVFLLALVLALLGGSPFGYVEIPTVLAVASGLSIAGALVTSSAARAELWERYRRPLQKRGPG